MDRRLLPPTLVLLLLLVTVPLGLVAPVLGPLAWGWRLFGVAPLLGGLLLTQRSNALFLRSGAEIGTFDDPTLLVTSGPFAHTRNPMYMGFSIFLVGAALTVGSLTAWLAPTAFVVAADRWYIPFEEQRMLAVFGTGYTEYQSQVPRWLFAVSRKPTGSHDRS
jgi:protein-S-isoprenylcysteine O-methyltransferase Ste14